MTMIDSAIDDVAGRFGLGPKSGQLMHEVVHLITGSPGGLLGGTLPGRVVAYHYYGHDAVVRVEPEAGAGPLVVRVHQGGPWAPGEPVALVVHGAVLAWAAGDGGTTSA